MVLSRLAFLGACADGDTHSRLAVNTANTANTADTVAAHYVYFVLLSDAPDDKTRALLGELLEATGDFPTDFSTLAALIIPRAGMVSPWASKAGDILKRCGIANLRRVERGILIRHKKASDLAAAVCDRMTQSVLVLSADTDWMQLFAENPPKAQTALIPSDNVVAIINKANQTLGLALSTPEISHLTAMYARLNKEPTEPELLMFAQANSEHCRHKIFNAAWTDGEPSLMSEIRRTHEENPAGVVVAFSDNSAIVEGIDGSCFYPNINGTYEKTNINPHIIVKAETHNHPTAISPFSGAATGNGGEIRDEAAAGRGGVSRAGFCGFAVSRLSLPQCGDMPSAATPKHIASALQIMIEGPLGAADYNNEFGRPTLGGFFRCYESQHGDKRWGFHKPLMLAGGFGHILPHSAIKRTIPLGAKIIQLGGPGFRIGMGGGTASSRTTGGDAALDFDSVQRGNAEMQRRAQEVIEHCRHNPDGGEILSLHDVGAGGLANAVIELVYQSGRGAHINLAAVPVEDSSLSPAEIWCNESQERYVLALPPSAVEDFAKICARERCPFAIIGEATESCDIIVVAQDGTPVVSLPLGDILGDLDLPPLKAQKAEAMPHQPPAVAADLKESAYAVLRHPSVASKRFLINIGDRSVGGLTAREQMVGPWQTPVADCAAFFNDYDSVSGVAFALGEKAAVAALSPVAGVRMAIAESLTNLAAADIGDLRRVKLSLNWLANCGVPTQNGALREAVYAAADFCCALGVGVVVGKDSLSMQMPVSEGAPVESPALAVATAFAPISDATRVLTPQLSGRDDTLLMLASPHERHRLGASVFSPTGGETPDVSASALSALWRALTECRRENLLLSYHDCSDGGLWAAACEMAFAANSGLSLLADTLCGPASETDGGEMNRDALAEGGMQKLAAALFNEEIGVLLEVKRDDAARVLQIFSDNKLPKAVQTVGYPVINERRVRVYLSGRAVLNEALDDLRRCWDETSYEICRRRDDTACAEEEHRRDYENDSGLFAKLPPTWKAESPMIGGNRPKVAILREQGLNGQREMAAAFFRAGFDAVDVHMSDLLEGRHRLDKSFQGMALAGGFSFGDVLGAGRGWAYGILQDARLAEMFREFFARDDAFVLGVCNGCQALSFLQPLMPLAEKWQFPRFLPNRSRRFEARLTMVEIMDTVSPLLDGMAGAQLPIIAAHGEGRAVFDDEHKTQAPLFLRFTDNHGQATETYPFNPNGSVGGKTGFSSPDGRIVLMMTHPERVFRTCQFSWQPHDWKNMTESPWHKIFTNAKRFVT